MEIIGIVGCRVERGEKIANDGFVCIHGSVRNRVLRSDKMRGAWAQFMGSQNCAKGRKGALKFD